MEKNEIIKVNESIFRILSLNDNKVLVIDCIKATMPIWIDFNSLINGKIITEEELLITLNTTLLPYDNLSNIQKKTVQEKYNLIAPIINCIDFISERNEMIQRVYERKGLSKQTIRKYLCQYLIYQDICCFAKPKKEKNLSDNEKNYRYILNKYYYNSARRSLKTCYLYLLREKYTDINGNLLEKHPKYHQLKYYYYKHRKLENYYISRYGKGKFFRDNKCLLGDYYSYFNSVGYGEVDSTIADIWLVDNNNSLVGRANVVAMVDAFSQLLLGYSIGYEGGTTSLRDLMINVNSNKGVPSHIITDRGKEYTSFNYSQLTEIGVEIVTLSAYAPDRKGLVEKFFDVIQNYFKQYLQNNGVIREDYAIRGAQDYRLNATFTLEEFKHIFQICVEHYNTQRLIKNIPYDCVVNKVKPFSKDIFDYSYTMNPNSFIKISNEELEKVLMPRTNAKFTRKGLVALNGLRFRALGYVDRFLKGGEALVAYNPYNVSFVYLIENGEFIKFDLIEQFFKDKSLEEVNKIKKQKKEIIKQYSEESLESEMNMGVAIDDFVSHKQHQKVNTKNVRQHRQNEIKKERLKKGD